MTISDQFDSRQLDPFLFTRYVSATEFELQVVFKMDPAHRYLENLPQATDGSQNPDPSKKDTKILTIELDDNQGVYLPGDLFFLKKRISIVPGEKYIEVKIIDPHVSHGGSGTVHFPPPPPIINP